ncbi:restriction endonuclease subunit S [Proteus vulgaris]|uniref:restriction endonuclease subunit S n=1 Tax=Proteus vulgaris TaxID=585 RepID=UPI0021B0F332|nr:restriction endonuclease subunit S [Proteus vulgaris]MCT6517649.1 restriction endonuclease subunit S [Proteus vulgaris]
MSADKKVPDIRFKGFTREWDYFPLEAISDVLDGDRGHNYPNGEELKEQGHTLFLSASNVTKNGFKFDIRQYITQDKSDKLGNGKLIIGDIVLTSRGSIGHIAWYNENITKKIPFARINSGMLILRVKNNIDPNVISQYLTSPEGKKKIETISFGSAQPQLTKASVLKLPVTIPSEKLEQTAIGNYFQKLDSLINQHQQKHDTLNNIKKAMLEKMFPKPGETVPEIRFKGFSGEWEEKDFSDIASRVSTYHKSTHLPCVEYEDIVSGTGKFNKDIHQKRIFKAGLKFEVNDVLFGKLRPYLKNWFLADFEGIAVGDFWVLRAENVTSTFLFSLIQTSKFELVSNLSAGSKMPRSDWKLISSSCFFVPKNISESYKIGNYFQKLDTLINQHQQQITKLNNIKQACLSKMFI